MSEKESEPAAPVDNGLSWLQQNAGNYETGGERVAHEGGALPHEVAAPAAEVPSGEGPGGPQAEPGGVQGEAPAPLLSGEGGAKLMEKAMTALGRGLGDMPKELREKTIEAMSEQERLDVGLRMAESQAERDRLGSAMGRSNEDKDSEQDQAADSGDAGADPIAPAESDKLDLEKLLAPYDFDLNLEEDLPKALTAVASEVARHTQAQMQEAHTAELQGLREGFDNFVRDMVGRQLVERFPQLQDAATKAEVMRTMARIAPGLEHAEGTSLFDRELAGMELACKITLGQKASLTPTQALGGQPPVPSSKPAPKPQERSSDERSIDFLRTLSETGNLQAAKRAYQGT